MSDTKSSNEISFYENTIKECKDFLRESGELQKHKIIKWAEALEELGHEKQKIAAKIQDEASTELGYSDGQCNYIREILSPLGYTDSKYSHKGAVNRTLENLSVEDQIESKLEEIEDKLETLPDSRKQRVLSTISNFTKEKNTKKPKSLDVGIHQAEPPKARQGVSEFSEAIGLTASWFESAAERYRKIQSEIEIYKPEDAKERADDWNSVINSIIIPQILHPLFMEQTEAEADRKYSTSKYHWIKIIRERIVQSKHGAGKKSENYITDPLTGKPVYNKKGKPVKRGNSRERVSDTERPTVEEAIRVIESNAGLMTLHDWLENVQGGHRRYRKEILHDYFSEAATGSIKSGNENYEQFMAEYKKKQQEKYSSQ